MYLQRDSNSFILIPPLISYFLSLIYQCYQFDHLKRDYSIFQPFVQTINLNWGCDVISFTPTLIFNPQTYCCFTFFLSMSQYLHSCSFSQCPEPTTALLSTNTKKKEKVQKSRDSWQNAASLGNTSRHLVLVGRYTTFSKHYSIKIFYIYFIGQCTSRSKTGSGFIKTC